MRQRRKLAPSITVKTVSDIPALEDLPQHIRSVQIDGRQQPFIVASTGFINQFN